MASQRIRQLDVIRVAGVVCVIALLHEHGLFYAVHATGARVASGAVYHAVEWTALGLLFYVSGYATGSRYGAPLSGGLRHFLRRRLLRLWPLYAVVLTAFWLLWFRGASPVWVLAQYACMGPLVVRWLGVPVLTLWFVQVLIAFDVAFALVASRASRNARLGSLGLMAAALVILTALHVVDQRLFTYAPVFVLGVWSAQGLRNPAARHALVALATIAYLLLAWVVVTQPRFEPGKAQPLVTAALPVVAVPVSWALASYVGGFTRFQGLLAVANYAVYCAYLTHRLVVDAMAKAWSPEIVSASILWYCVAAVVLSFVAGYWCQRANDACFGNASVPFAVRANRAVSRCGGARPAG